MARVYFTQYHLHVQLQAASRYAEAQGVALKGDIPIGVTRCSADVWAEPGCFKLSHNAGAPGDPEQNWGFPPYNWEEMHKDNCLWWRRRLSHMAQYFHAYRIDHILGFFRMWEIPVRGGKSGYHPGISTIYIYIYIYMYLYIYVFLLLCMYIYTPAHV